MLYGRYMNVKKDVITTQYNEQLLSNVYTLKEEIFVEFNFAIQREKIAGIYFRGRGNFENFAEFNFAVDTQNRELNSAKISSLKVNPKKVKVKSTTMCYESLQYTKR